MLETGLPSVLTAVTREAMRQKENSKLARLVYFGKKMEAKVLCVRSTRICNQMDGEVEK
jgi:hypothetical protein